MQAYQRGRMITQEQLDLIRAYDKKDPYVMDSLLERVCVNQTRSFRLS